MPHYSVDSFTYSNQADSLSKGIFPVYFPNGYPLIILFFSLFGNPEYWLLLLNIVLSFSGVFLCGLILYKLTKNFNTALIGAVFIGFYPNQLNYVRFILTEVPSGFLLVLSVYLLIKTVAAPGKMSWNYLGAAGLALGAAGVMKPVILLCGFLFAGALLKFYGKKVFVMFFSSMILLPLMLMSASFFMTGKFILGQSFVHNFFITIGDTDLKLDSLITAISRYFNFAIQNPAEFIEGRFLTLWKMWGFYPADTGGMLTNPIFKVLMGLRFFLVVGGIYFFIRSKRGFTDYLLIIPAISVTVVHFFFYSNPRYSFPAEPFLIISLFYFMHFYFQKRKSIA